MSTNVKFEVPTMKELNDFQKLVYENGGPEKVRFWFPTEMREYIPLLGLYMSSFRDREYFLLAHLIKNSLRLFLNSKTSCRTF